MSQPLWQTNLESILRARPTTDSPLRVAVVGVGNELRGDDAAGVAVARALRCSRDVLVIDASAAPENCTAVLRDFGPDLVLLVDAVQMNGRPGEIMWIDEANISGISASTHTLPLDVLTEFLRLDLGCEVELIGIQPLTTDFDAPLSPSVALAVAELS